MPLLAEGLDVDGSDVSADMIGEAKAQAVKNGFKPRLTVQPMHELDLERNYRTIYMCGSFGIGGRRDHDREALRRAYRHLEPGGGLVIANHELPYAGRDEKGWARWLPGQRDGIPREWPTVGDRRTTSDGDEILDQHQTLEIRARLWRRGHILKEEAYCLKLSLYFAQEIVLLLDQAGFRDLAVEAGYTGRPATADDGTVAFVARK